MLRIAAGVVLVVIVIALVTLALVGAFGAMLS